MYYAGLDVSLDETFVCIIDEEGKIVAEESVATNVDTLSTYLKKIVSVQSPHTKVIFVKD